MCKCLHVWFSHRLSYKSSFFQKAFGDHGKPNMLYVVRALPCVVMDHNCFLKVLDMPFKFSKVQVTKYAFGCAFVKCEFERTEILYS